MHIEDREIYWSANVSHSVPKVGKVKNRYGASDVAPQSTISAFSMSLAHSVRSKLEHRCGAVRNTLLLLVDIIIVQRISVPCTQAKSSYHDVYLS